MPEEESEEGEHDDSPDKEGEKDNKTSKEDNEESQEPNYNENESSETVALSIRSLMIGVFVMGLAIGFSGGVLTGSGTDLIGNLGSDISPTQPSDSESNNQGETETIDMNRIDMEGEPVLGEEDAPVTMVVYEDFECPFCKRFEEGAVSQIKSNYVDSGKVKIVWKDRPLGKRHPWADPAAATMECVYREGGDDPFWTVKDKIFANQDSIEVSNVESKIKGWAAEEGVSESAVQSCIDNGNPMEEVNADNQEGLDVGAGGTPTSFINGQKIVGAQPYGNFESAIESALNG